MNLSISYSPKSNLNVDKLKKVKDRQMRNIKCQLLVFQQPCALKILQKMASGFIIFSYFFGSKLVSEFSKLNFSLFKKEKSQIVGQVLVPNPKCSIEIFFMNFLFTLWKTQQLMKNKPNQLHRNIFIAIAQPNSDV